MIRHPSLKILCRKLNRLIPVKTQEEADIVFEMVREMTTWKDINTNCALYYDRELYIDSNYDYDTIWRKIFHDDNIQFEVSDDRVEHPGIVVRYKTD